MKSRTIERHHQVKEGSVVLGAQTRRMGRFLEAAERKESDARCVTKTPYKRVREQTELNRKATIMNQFFFFLKLNTLKRNNEQVMQKQGMNIFMIQQPQAHL